MKPSMLIVSHSLESCDRHPSPARRARSTAEEARGLLLQAGRHPPPPTPALCYFVHYYHTSLETMSLLRDGPDSSLSPSITRVLVSASCISTGISQASQQQVPRLARYPLRLFVSYPCSPLLCNAPVAQITCAPTSLVFCSRTTAHAPRLAFNCRLLSDGIARETLSEPFARQ